MKIIHIITTIDRGGAENQLLTLASQQVIDGLQVKVIPLKGNLELKNEFILNGIEVIDSFANKFWLAQVLELKNYFKKCNFDVIHAHLPRAEVTSALCVDNDRFLVTRHNSESFFPGSPNLVSIILSKWVTKKAFGVICISNAVKDFLMRKREINCKSQVIYYGTKLNKESNLSREKSKLAFKNALALSPSTKIVSTLSRLTSQKDLQTLLRAFEEVSRTEDKIHLIIAGEGELEFELKKLSKKLGISNKVSFLGKISNTRELYFSTDVFVLTSKYEGFGLVLLEAMEYRLPIVASNNTSIPEVIGATHEGLTTTGDYAEFAKKIKRFLNSAEAKKLIEFQNMRIQLFDIKKTSAEHLIIYKQLQ